MKTISLHQPWASAIALSLKKWETRGRPTHVRGRIAIHAAKNNSRELRLAFLSLCALSLDIHDRFAVGDFPDFSSLPFGAILATADLTSCCPADEIAPWLEPIERSLGDYTFGRFAWKLENVQPLKQPIPFKGRQGWFEIPNSLLAA